jgi:DNA invertase Pin-like site-specific DNA recombinase
MPRRKRPHRFEVIHLDPPPGIPATHHRALYTRLSDDDPESVSHAQQEARARAFADAHGLAITAIYRDWRTGFDPNRLAFKQLADDAHHGLHAGVLFDVPDRLYRGITGVAPVLALRQQLPAYRFDAASAAFNIDDTAVWAALSQHEVTQTRRRSIEQSRHRAALGELVQGRRPYWIERDPGTHRPVVVPERARAVLDAIDQYAAGVPIGQVARWMSAHAPAGGHTPHWSEQRLRRTFRHPALGGDLPFARTLVITERRAGELFVVGRGVRDDAVPLQVEPLLHRTELERAECEARGGCPRDTHVAMDTLDELIRANRRRQSGRPATVPHPLRRRVVCACGWRMTYQPRVYPSSAYRKRGPQSFGTLLCIRTTERGRSVVREYPRCPTWRLPTRRLWPLVQQQFIAAVRDPDRVIAEVEAAILQGTSAQARSQADEAAALDQLQAQLARLDDEEYELYRDWKAGDVSRAVYDRERARLDSARRGAEHAKRQLLDRRTILQRASGATASLRQGLVEAGRLDFDTLTLEQWTELFDALISDVVLDEQGNPRLRWRQAGPLPQALPVVSALETRAAAG